MYTAVIIDDEPDAIISLKLTIQKYLNEKIEIVGTARSVKDGVEKIKTTNPDLVFLDIEMPNENGFELFKYFKDGINFDVVFTTAYEQYGIRAVKCAALDYLLKPVNFIELRESLTRLEMKKSTELPLRQIEILLGNLQPNYDTNKIAIPTSTGIEMLAVREIMYGEGDGNYSNLHLINGKTIKISKTLSWLEEILPNDYFFRIHKKYYVNLGHVRTFDRSAGNLLVLDNGKELEVSSRKQGDLSSRLLTR